jgi:single-strand DNA-binding protein
MANLNKVMLIGRLTRDPEVRTFANGGKVAKFGFAVNNRKLNQQTNQWEDEPVFIDMEAFNRGDTGKLADRIEQTLTKGRQIFIEGHLRLDQWTDKEGQKRSRLLVRVDNFQYLDAKPDGAGGEGGSRFQRSSAPAASKPASRPSSDYDEPMEPEPEPPAPRGTEEEIPF